MKTVIDKEKAEIAIMRTSTGFAKARFIIDYLKEKNLPLWWDLLYEALKSGNPCDLYAQRWAQNNFMDWNDVKVKNELRLKFEVLQDPYHRYQFPQKWVRQEADGSFDIDKEAIRRDVEKQHTYTISDKQEKAIRSIVDAMNELDLNTHTFDYFFLYDEKGKIEPHWERIGEAIAP